MVIRTRKLKPSEVHYLSFEGGGGRAGSFIGALAGMAEKGIDILRPVTNSKNKDQRQDYVLNRERIKGIAGSSSGSIIALLLAIGFTLGELYALMTGPEIKKFYDKAVPCQYPQISDSKNFVNADNKNYNSSSTLRDALAERLLTNIPPSTIQYFLSKTLEELNAPTLAQVCAINPINYLYNFFTDYGLFSGCYCRNFFANAIAQKKSGEKNIQYTKKDDAEITFKEFAKCFKTQLIVTGVNIETRKVHYFSADQTADFKVADAIRISMSLPVAFKPVVIKKGQYSDDTLVGTWIDGGILVDNPIHAFDQYNEQGKRDQNLQYGVINKGMLGLRLGNDERRLANNFLLYWKAILDTIADNAKIGQIHTSQEYAQIINLPTDNLHTLEFSPPKQDIDNVCKKSSKAVLQYFNYKREENNIFDFISSI